MPEIAYPFPGARILSTWWLPEFSGPRLVTVFMSRPTKNRRVCRLPGTNTFGPVANSAGCPGRESVVVMTIEEYETLRLIDLEKMTQQECSEQMQVARTTVQSIYEKAREKLSDSLVHGKYLQIQGGHFSLCQGDFPPHCRRRCCPRLQMSSVSPSTSNPEQKINSMKIAIPVLEDKATVCASFGRTPLFALVDIEANTTQFLENSAASSPGGAGIKASQILVDQKVSSVLTPRCGENAAQVFNKAGISLYKTQGESLSENIASFKAGILSILSDIHPGFHHRP